MGSGAGPPGALLGPLSFCVSFELYSMFVLSWALLGSSASHSSFIVFLCSPLIFLSIFIRLPQKTTPFLCVSFEVYSLSLCF